MSYTFRRTLHLMMTRRTGHTYLGVISNVLLLFLVGALRITAEPVSLYPSTMSRIGTVDERFQSYNIEMIEVTGGRFWKPYSQIRNAERPAPAGPPRSTPGAPPGAPPADLYEYRAPTDLSNVRLRRLAAALGPAYVRVSGTWANSVYFHDSDDPPPQTPPAGFNGVLSRKQWKGVIDFARAVDARIVTSFATSVGTRDEAGVWTPSQARRFVAYTKRANGSIAAAEFMNEPNFAAMGGAPKGYDADAFARDIGVFQKFLKEASPSILFLGPGSVGEGGVLGSATMPGGMKTEDILRATGPAFDVFSYHLYGAVSQRCAGGMPSIGIAANEALSQDWLVRPDKIHAFYAGLRDRFAPGKPLWNTETADAACGGNPWASTFLDTFRYLNQHARLAQQGLQLIAHNTLSASDYGLIDEKTFTPRPNYWGAVLWRRLMGTTVLSPGPAPSNGLYIYAHCMRDHPGGVTVLAINTAKTPQNIDAPLRAERYTLTAEELESSAVALNGHALEARSDATLPAITGTQTRPGQLRLPAVSITFLAFPAAGNTTCE